MTPLRRPPSADRQRWVDLPRTKKARAAIAQRVAAGNDPPKSDDFDPAWNDLDWASALAAAQDGLCAWCTRNATEGGHCGVVDHIRPRAAVTRMIDEEGLETPPRFNVEGRLLLPRPPLTPGYYWRAYDPENLAYSCERCNTGWKRTLWPVRQAKGSPWFPPAPMVGEEELLLDPFAAGFNPLAHFRYGQRGAITHRDERAEVTIAVLGLDRPSLCAAREKKQRSVQEQVGSVARALETQVLDSGQALMLAGVAERCAWRTPHAAFYRVALHHTLGANGLSWSALRAAWDRHGLAGDIAEPPDDAWID